MYQDARKRTWFGVGCAPSLLDLAATKQDIDTAAELSSFGQENSSDYQMHFLFVAFKGRTQVYIG